MASDWQDSLTLLESMDYMLTNEVDCDISFKLGKTGSDIVSAHRFVLASRSSVFRAMLYGPLAEKGCSVEIPDVESDIFRCFLRYLYTDKCVMTPDSVAALMYTAHKYNVRRLVNECGQFLMKNMSTSNVCTVMEHAYLFDDSKLRQNSLDFIENHSIDVIKDKLLTDLGRECLGDVLRSDKLGANEEDIFAAVLSWSDYRCTEKGLEVNDSNRRQVLGDLLYLVRFPLMNPKMCVNIVENHAKLLTAEEQNQLLKGHITNDFSKTGFSSKKRKYPQRVCYRFRESNMCGRWSYNAPDTLQFKVSEAVYITGVVLFGNTGSTYNVIAGILECGEVVHTRVTLDSNTFQVMFNTPFSAKPDTYYTLKADLQCGPRGIAGRNGMINVTCKSTVFTFQTAPTPTNGTDNTKGQIYGIIFEKR
ncbi:BTB/POZ domain-containing protein 6-like [Ylistrum balloti]|uniref:BTB/POZ domain-containing protein 6-like n=1 Tax=Ylistrum balloti TaxID=509963 RepID=UPI0029059AB3|nr:BTB/POZ domain-containing protein 6-like [Ylistrum balloti]